MISVFYAIALFMMIFLFPHPFLLPRIRFARLLVPLLLIVSSIALAGEIIFAALFLSFPNLLGCYEHLENLIAMFAFSRLGRGVWPDLQQCLPDALVFLFSLITIIRWRRERKALQSVEDARGKLTDRAEDLLDYLGLPASMGMHPSEALLTLVTLFALLLAGDAVLSWTHAPFLLFFLLCDQLLFLRRPLRPFLEACAPLLYLAACAHLLLQLIYQLPMVQDAFPADSFAAQMLGLVPYMTSEVAWTRAAGAVVTIAGELTLLTVLATRRCARQVRAAFASGLERGDPVYTLLSTVVESPNESQSYMFSQLARAWGFHGWKACVLGALAAALTQPSVLSMPLLLLGLASMLAPRRFIDLGLRLLLGYVGLLIGALYTYAGPGFAMLKDEELAWSVGLQTRGLDPRLAIAGLAALAGFVAVYFQVNMCYVFFFVSRFLSSRNSSLLNGKGSYL